MGTEETRIEYVPLSELKRWPRNPKLHASDVLDASIERFGFVQPLLVDERTGQLVAGHGRLEALQARKAAGGAAPARVKEENGDWLVPVVRGVSFANDREAEAYLVADNRLVELGGWDDTMLAELLRETRVCLDGVGFDDLEVDRILAGGGVVDPEVEWQGMPEFHQEDQTAVRKIVVNFKTEEDAVKFGEVLGQTITRRTDSIWFPEVKRSPREKVEKI